MRTLVPSLPAGSASWRNVLLLMQLRWIAVIGQLATIVAVAQVLEVRLPLTPLLMAPLLLIVVNLATACLLKRRKEFSQGELFGALLIDVGALCWQLYHSGGATNPFTFLFLLQIVIGAVMLELRWSWVIAFIACAAILFLTFVYVPLDLPPRHATNQFHLYRLGSLFCFVLAAVLLVVFPARLDRNRRESDKELELLRQQAAEEDHIIRMGLLASGAAHELGTPLSSMSVILGDWARVPAIAENPEFAADLVDMRVELERCKTIVSGILMSAGDLRGENPSVSTVRALFADIVEEWRGRMNGEFRFVDRLVDDVVIVADPGLRQIIGNVIDNAVEVSPELVILEIAREGEALTVTVFDQGPGFTAGMLTRIGQPYASTKGRDGGGLGLFLVVNVVRKLGGQVTVENRDAGGAIVRLSLPLSALAYRKEEAP
ncbi:HAMP domain-containing histidine kinase [Novosphingobium flavum]|uniref:histidine kinase n=1 Tax=Novosphingobium flavum TaxID=1778672 RepID=A0A7X1KNB2_9SPHN|nr:ATP-binding protein [Novosphingobium flavum]MBC2667170.1 HAMP domain-containing histidine kinase [Novosphingobium flavum]